jgi:hypothetical protein
VGARGSGRGLDRDESRRGRRQVGRERHQPADVGVQLLAPLVTAQLALVLVRASPALTDL